MRAKHFLLLSFLLLAFNLRPALTVVGPLIGSIHDATGLSSAALGALSSLPLLAFAAFAPLANFGRRFGLERTLAVAMVLLFAGIVLRSSGSIVALYAGTLVLGAGIAIGNVLAPSLIKRDYAERVGSLTTVYALILALSAAVASGLAVPLERLLPGGWRSSLAVWAVPAAIAAVLWVRVSLQSQAPAVPVATSTTRSVWCSPLAWQVTAYMGLQSLTFYVAIAWLPTVMQDAGYDAAAAGVLITVFQIISMVAGAALPRLLSLRRDQSVLAVCAALAITAGVFGLLVYPQWTIAWLGLTGIGSGVSFPLALAFIGLRSTDHHQAASLSLMSQSMGYLLAAFGPVLFGLAHDISGGWALPLGCWTVCGLLQGVAGYASGRARTISGART